MISLKCRVWIIDFDKKEAYFDNNNEFTNILSVCKKLCSDSIMNPDVKGLRDIRTEMENTVMCISLLSSPNSANRLKKTLRNALVLTPPSMKGTENRISCTSSNCYAINKNSKHIEEAWEFIKLLISEEMQSTKDYQIGFSGFPVNNKALDNMVDNFLNLYSTGRCGSGI